MIVVDVGAHDGSAYALPFAQSESNIVYAIEPIPELADGLRRRNKKNLMVCCAAVSDYEGEQQFHINSDQQTSSLLEVEQTEAWGKYADQLSRAVTITVPVIRLDQFMQQHDIAEIDLLKIDTQGNDFAVLKGAGTAISRIKRIILEVQLSPLYKGAASKDQVISYLEARGFRCVSATPQSDDLEENLEFVRINRYPLSSRWSQQLSVEVPFVGALQFPQQDHVGKLLEQGVFEGPEQAFVWLYLRSGDSFLDCGAHVGLFSCVALKAMAQEGQVIAIEPNPRCVDLLRENVVAYGGDAEQVLAIGLAEKSGQADLFLGGDGFSAFSTFTPASTASEVSGQTIQVEQQSLDEVLEGRGVDFEFTLAKLDVEGWEIPVLNGAAQAISDSKLPVWMVEFTEENARAVGSSTQELRSRLEALGYTLCHFNATSLQLEPEPNYPVYEYKNLYAVRDLSAVNARLAQAPPERIAIAREIIRQWDVAVSAQQLQFTLNQQKEQSLNRINELQQKAYQEKQALRQESQASLTVQAAEHQEKVQALEQQHQDAMQAAQAELADAHQDQIKAQEDLLSLRQKLHALDTSRANIIHQLSNERTQIAAYNTHLTKQVADRDRRVQNLEQRLQNKQQQLEHVEAEVARLQVGREAFKEVVKSLLRRLKLYAAVKRVLRGPEAPTQAAVPSTNALPQTAAEEADAAVAIALTPDVAIQSDRAKAIVVARALGTDVAQDTAALEPLIQVMADAKSVLCIEPHRRMIPLLQHFSDSGRTLICVSQTLAQELSSYGIPLQPSVADWLARSTTPLSEQCDLVCLGDISEGDYQLLQGRLAADTALLVARSSRENPSGFQRFGVAPSAVTQIGHFDYVSSPPAPWIDPLHQAAAPDAATQGQRWPWNFEAPELPDVMPSGRPWPKISIVTVSFNHGHFIEETIRSVLGQGYPNLEYIVIDGGSTDQTVSILKRYDNEIAYWISEPDKGQSNALNKGFQRATGEIVAWLNSDDRYLPHTLARVAMAFDTYHTDMVVGGCQLVQDYRLEPFRTHRSRFPVGEVVPLPLEDLLDIENCWHQGHFFYQPEVFWTRDLWQRSGGHLDEALFYSMDYDLWVRMAQQNATVVHSPDALALYRVHSDQKTFGDDVPYMPELKGVSDRYRAQSPQPPSKASTRERHDD